MTSKYLHKHITTSFLISQILITYSPYQNIFQQNKFILLVMKALLYSLCYAFKLFYHHVNIIVLQPL